MILIVDKTKEKQDLIQESLQKLLPGYQNFVGDNGKNPFEVLKQQQWLEMVIICEPATAYYSSYRDQGMSGHQADHAVEWIDALRHGVHRDDRAVQYQKLIINPKTKEQLPILYIHPGFDVDKHYPSSFPAHFLIEKSTLPKAMKFTKKWYKSIGANEVVFYPWEPEQFKQAFLNCINKTTWTQELPNKTVKTGDQRHGH